MVEEDSYASLDSWNIKHFHESKVDPFIDRKLVWSPDYLEGKLLD